MKKRDRDPKQAKRRDSDQRGEHVGVQRERQFGSRNGRRSEFESAVQPRTRIERRDGRVAFTAGSRRRIRIRPAMRREDGRGDVAGVPVFIQDGLVDSTVGAVRSIDWLGDHTPLTLRQGFFVDDLVEPEDDSADEHDQVS